MKSILSVQKLARMIETIFEHEISDIELSRGQYAYILYLNDHGGANQLDISQNLLIDKTTVAKALKKLEANKYIIRRTDPRDKRKVKVYLSNKGKEAYEEISSTFSAMEDKLTSQIRSSNEQEFERLLELYIQELDLTWSRIKNYKKKEVFEVADQSDLEQVALRRGQKLRDGDQLFVKKAGTYVINWLRFEDVPEHALIKEISLHSNEAERDDDAEILDEFLKWHDARKSEDVYFRVEESDVALQKFADESDFYFSHFDEYKGIKRYYYNRIHLLSL